MYSLNTNLNILNEYDFKYDNNGLIINYLFKIKKDFKYLNVKFNKYQLMKKIW